MAWCRLGLGTNQAEGDVGILIVGNWIVKEG